jgi:hypothetical protein
MMLQNYERRLTCVSTRKPFFLSMLSPLLVLVISLSLVLVIFVDIQGTFVYATLSSFPSFTENLSPVTVGNLSTGLIPSAGSVHSMETLELPRDIDAFIILIVNEAHESWQDERHKLLTDRNAYYIPTNLIVHEGTRVAFLDADAPWDTPHPQTIDIVNRDTEEVVYSTGVLVYTNSSEPVGLSPGNYSIVNQDYDAKEGNILVLPDTGNQVSSSGNITGSDLIVGGFYTPTNQVENSKDNDGLSHPGSLQYYTEEFEKNGFAILSEHNFSYGTCDYCPGAFWPDNKSGDHTLILYSTQQSLSEALAKLERLVKDNVYI